MSKTNTQLKKAVTKFIKAKAKALKSDWNDVPLWMIDAFVEFMGSSKPTTKQETIKLAEAYLSGNHNTEDVIKAIINHKDKNDLIDYVDGVEVWQKVEFCFTCKDFLEAINYISSDWK